MRLRYRLALVSFGIIAFLIATPILVLYARGFQWDWKNHQFVKTGALVVKTEPTKSTVFINDIKQNSLTPLSVRFLAPGDYNVRVEKTGFMTWSKRLSIKTQLVTWANQGRDFITLFLQQSTLEHTWPAAGIAVSDQKDKIAYLDAKQVKEIDVTTGQTSDVANFPTPNPVPSPDQIRSSLKTLGVDLPDFTNGQIVHSSNQIYLILDKTLYLINGALEKIYSPVTAADWDNASSQLLYANDNEIYIYQPDTKNSELVFRSVTQIDNPVLNTATGYVFFQNENKVKSIELDGRDHRNVFTIADAQDNFVVSEDGKKLFTFSQSEINEFIIR
jgi:hypothetical protein